MGPSHTKLAAFTYNKSFGFDRIFVRKLDVKPHLIRERYPKLVPGLSHVWREEIPPLWILDFVFPRQVNALMRMPKPSQWKWRKFGKICLPFIVTVISTVESLNRIKRWAPKN